MRLRSRKKIITYITAFFVAFTGYLLIIKSFEENIIYFLKPSEIKYKNVNDKEIRIGGLVKSGSIVMRDNMNWQFVLCDEDSEIIVQYQGMMPNLFRDGQGVIAKGRLKESLFLANEILAKHDEKYMPKAVVDELKQKGYWKK
jgi:cytochrome c-type biogenesis protein CcmE